MKGLLCLLAIGVAYANDLQPQLMDIALQEAAIANIGSNKLSMLYGTADPIPIINRWNSVAHRPPLTELQINRIKLLEAEKQAVFGANNE